MKYTYTDHKTNEIKVYHASNLTEADEMYEKENGIHPIKLMHVGCQIEKE